MTLTRGRIMRARVALSLLLAAAHPSLAVAQWSLAPEVGIVGFGHSARDTAAGIELGSTRVTAFGFRLARQGTPIGIAVRLRYGTSGLAATDGDITVIQEHTFKLYDISAIAAWRLTRLGVGTVLLESGPVASIWKAKGGESRTRVGASAALALQIAMTPRYTGTIRAEVGISPSMFDQVDLPAGVERRATWRTGVAIEVGRRF